MKETKQETELVNVLSPVLKDLLEFADISMADTTAINNVINFMELKENGDVTLSGRSYNQYYFLTFPLFAFPI